MNGSRMAFSKASVALETYRYWRMVRVNMDFFQTIQFALSTVLPSAAAGVIVLCFEYLSPWFARRRVEKSRRELDSLPIDEQWIHNFQVKLRKSFPPKTYDYKYPLTDSRRNVLMEPEDFVMLSFKSVGLSHYEVIVDTLPYHRQFAVLCDHTGSVAKMRAVRFRPASLSDFFSPFSIIMSLLFWLTGWGVYLGILRIIEIYTGVYRGAGLDIYVQSPILILALLCQLLVLPPALFGYGAHVLRTIGIRIQPRVALAAAFLIWVPVVVLLGAYPEHVRRIVDSYVFWYNDFHARGRGPLPVA
jgi:hypothetical protein